MNLRIIGQSEGWTASAKLVQYGKHTLVVTPCMCLGYHAITNIVCGWSYKEAFADCHISIEGELRDFDVVHSTFDLYETSQPSLSNFAAIVYGEGPRPGLAALIRDAAKALQ